MADSKIIDTLNSLLELLHDSFNGYRECTANVSDEALRNLFTDFSAKRETMMKNLEAAIRSLGGEPKQSGSMTGVMHRLFIDLKGLLTGNDVKAVAKEVERGEGYTIEHYQKTLDSDVDLPDDVAALLQEQMNEIQSNLSRVKSITAI